MSDEAVEELVNAALDKLKKEHNLHRCEEGLVLQRDNRQVLLIQPFKVRGTAKSIDGSLLGVALAKKERLKIVPFKDVRNPLQLALSLEHLGLRTPSVRAHLAAIATYIATLADVKTVTVLDREGIYTVETDEEKDLIALVGSELIGDNPKKYLAIPSPLPSYRQRGDLHGWKDNVGPLLESNTVLIFALCFACAAPLSSLLGFPRTGVQLLGLAASDSAAVTSLLTSTYSEALEPFGEGNESGARAAQLLQAGLPIAIQLTGKTPLQKMLKTLQRGSSGSLSIADGALLVVGDGNATDHAETNAANMLLHRQVTMPSIVLHADEGPLHEALKANPEFGELVTEAVYDHYGVMLPAFIDGLFDDLAYAREYAHGFRLKADEHFDLGDLHLSDAERRVRDVFVNWAIGGELGVRHEVLPMTKDQPTAAVVEMFEAWLLQHRAKKHGASRPVLQFVSDFLRSNKNRFFQLEDWKKPRAATGYGYRNDGEDGSVFMVDPHIFKGTIAAKFGLSMTVKALREENLLVTDKKGRTKLIRMPTGDSDDRLPWFVIRKEILHYAEE